MRDPSPIIEKLYDAVLDFGIWPEVLGQVSDTLGSAGSALLSSSKQAGVWVRVDPDARKLFEQRFMGRNPIHAYATLARNSPNYRPAISTDRDIARVFNLERTAYFNEFLRPYDGIHSLTLDLGVRNMTAALNLSRTVKQGPFTEKEVEIAHILHSHLTRAFWLSVKLAGERQLNDGMLGMLERATFAAFLIDGTGHLAHMNAMGATMLRERNGLRCESSTLATMRSDTTATLQKLIAGALSTEPGFDKGGTLAIERPRRLPLTVTITPLRSDTQFELFSPAPVAIVCAFDPTSVVTFSAKHLREMFGLSAAEARVGAKLIEGLDQREIAQALGVSFFTVRAHMSQIFQKTHTNRQAEFVSLVMRTVNPALFGSMQ